MPNVARIYSELGDVYGRAAEARKSIWGQAIANISGIPSQIIAANQAAREKAVQQQRQQALLDIERSRLQQQQDEAAAKKADQDATEQVVAAMFADPSKPDPNAGIAKAIELNKGHLVPFIHQTAAAVAPHLEKIDTVDDAGQPVTRWVTPSAGTSYPKQPPKLTYSAPTPVMVDGKRQMVRTASDGSIIDMQGRKVEGVTITPDEPPMTPYQRAELGIQQQRLAKEGASEPLVAIIGPDNQPVLVPRSQAIGKRPATSREQGRPVTSGDAGKIAEYDSSLDDLATLRTTLQGKGATGIGAQIAAATPYVTQLTGWGAEAKERQAVIDRVKQVIGKALEGGVLRKEDEVKYEKILPKIGDAPEVAQSKLEGLDKAIRQKRARHLESLSDAGYDTSRFERTEPKGGTVKVLKIEKVSP